MISETRLEQAMRYLAETDVEQAELRGNVARAEYRAKSSRARALLCSSEKTVETKKADAEVSELVKEAEQELAKAIIADESMRAKRKTEALIVEVWRTMSANRRQAA